ncbi:hypothetical protein KY289_016800 [Solanum tuberosum]|nr:hypothetical protein KY289_016800 [Solanum tuberosum]
MSQSYANPKRIREQEGQQDKSSKTISKDFFDNDLPKPELSGDEDTADKLLRGECMSSCFRRNQLLHIYYPLNHFGPNHARAYIVLGFSMKSAHGWYRNRASTAMHNTIRRTSSCWRA